MRLRAEFTTEPFHGEGEAPPHALAALDLAESAGLECDFGPLGTSVAGTDDKLLPVLGEIMVAAFAHGATRVTMQVETDD
ncbi:thiamine-binding protein [Nocardia sp. NPDC059240]|uniref:thiamine-binding protein n=1 Tax=Nocardia sp. NPDC059240 TaxID=3346786 RepID=UPI00369397D9